MNKIKILFLCTGNSCRSQMAEGWCRHLKNEKIEAYSAGLKKHGLNPLALQVMGEAGVDISQQQSKTIEELPIQDFDLVITLCKHAYETCPFFPGKTIHKGFDDPPQLAANISEKEEILKQYRRIRDELHSFIETFNDKKINLLITQGIRKK